MKKRILAFGASNSKRSINRTLARFAAEQISDVEIDFLDLNDFEMPLFSIDREENEGIPALAHKFLERIDHSDGIILSLAEHNGAYSAAFKNLYDWTSRIRGSVWGNKALFLLSTSPGKRGASSVLDIASALYERRKNRLVARFSLPSFEENFSREEGITDPALRSGFEARLESFVRAL